MERKPDYILEGAGFLETFADYVMHYGDVALIITDQETAASHYTQRLMEALAEIAFRYEQLVIPNKRPTIEEVKEYWSELDCPHQPNILISVGQSATIHFAKALSIIAPYMGHVDDLFRGNARITTVLPHLTIPVYDYAQENHRQDISDIVSVLDRDQTPLDFAHRELIPRVVAYDPALEKVEKLAYRRLHLQKVAL